MSGNKNFREGYTLRETEDDVEGHSHQNLRAVEDESDVEGHNKSRSRAIEDESDVEGHGLKFKSPSSKGE